MNSIVFGGERMMIIDPCRISLPSFMGGECTYNLPTCAMVRKQVFQNRGSSSGYCPARHSHVDTTCLYKQLSYLLKSYVITFIICYHVFMQFISNDYRMQQDLMLGNLNVGQFVYVWQYIHSFPIGVGYVLPHLSDRYYWYTYYMLNFIIKVILSNNDRTLR